MEAAGKGGMEPGRDRWPDQQAKEGATQETRTVRASHAQVRSE